MALPRPIPPRLAREFFLTLQEYLRWRVADPEPSRTLYHHLIRISLVCGRVSAFSDPLPDEDFEALCFLMDPTHKHLKGQLRADRTYATAARCFVELIDNKKRRSPSGD